MSRLRGIGLLGGTFDPIHNAHIAAALAVKDHFRLEKVKFIPCANAPHREQSQRSARQRCEMVSLAIEGLNDLELDTRECQREGLSYTVDTLKSLREEFGEKVALLFIMGTDAFEKLNSWHQYEKILELCHLVVVERPDYEVENETVKAMIKNHQSEDPDQLMQFPAGYIYFLEGPRLDISATRIRTYFDLNMPNASKNIQSLSREIPEAVKHYIHQHGLYQERKY